MIDTRTYQPSESRWGDIYRQLKKDGIDVYSPGVKTGDCTSPYVVVSIGGATKHTSFSTDVCIYNVMCYVPKQSYSMLEPYVRKVEKSMEELRPMILPYGERQPSYYDDSYHAHMVSIQYKNYKKN